MSPTPAQTQTLLAAIILFAAAAALVWSMLALVARIAPRASLAAAAANGAGALGVSLGALRALLPDGLALLAAVLSMAALALLGGAATVAAGGRLPWRWGAGVVAGAALLLALLPDGAALHWQTAVASGAGAGLAFAAGVASWRGLRRVSGRRWLVTPLSLPMFLIALLLAARAVQVLVHPGSAADLREPSGFNHAFLWVALLLTLLQNTTLAFLITMRLILRIERLLERDPLTDTLNRRAFDQALERAHAWQRRGRGYALVMIDMDRFKQLNDTLGHAAGDAALRQLVRVVQPCVREVDRLGRLGGEEFCVLLPDTDLAGAALVAERMRLLVEQTPLRWLEQDWPLSASFGIAEAGRGDEAPGAVLARADAALYRAKRQGRNLVQA